MVKKIRFKYEEIDNDLPITFLGLVKDYNGVDIIQTSRKIKISAASYINRMLKTHGWDTASDGEIQDTVFKACMKSSKPISPIRTEVIKDLYDKPGPVEHSPEAKSLQRNMVFHIELFWERLFLLMSLLVLTLVLL